jgi:hypothetical protein
MLHTNYAGTKAPGEAQRSCYGFPQSAQFATHYFRVLVTAAAPADAGYKSTAWLAKMFGIVGFSYAIL